MVRCCLKDPKGRCTVDSGMPGGYDEKGGKRMKTERGKRKRKQAGSPHVFRKGQTLAALLLGIWMMTALTACGGRAPDSGTNGDVSVPETASLPGTEQESTAEGEGEKAMGRYMETEYDYPEGAGSFGRYMRILEDGTYAYADVTLGLWLSADQGKSWQQKSSMSDLFGEYAQEYIPKLAVSPDGRQTAGLMQTFGENHDVGCTLLVSDENGLVTAEGVFPDGDWITRLAYGRDGTLYAASLKGKICRFDGGETGLTQLFTALEGPEAIAFSEKSMFLLHNYGVEIYDLEQGVLQEGDAVLDEFVRENIAGRLGVSTDSIGADLIPDKDGVFYLAYRGGVYRHVLYGSVMEQIIDGQYSSFGDPTQGMCAVLLLEGGEFLRVTTGDTFTRFTSDPDEPTLPEKQLKLYSLSESSRLRQAVSAYQKEYPDVFVSYEVGMPDNSAVTLTDAVKSLNVKLLAGDGPDVILMDGIETEPYIQSGMLYDLSGVIDGFAPGELFENMVNACRTQEGTFVIPTNFSLPLLFGKKEDIEGITDLKTLADAVERLSRETEKGGVTGIWMPGRQLAQLTEICSPGWLSDRTLNEDAIREFLIQARRIYQADIAALSSEELELLVGSSEYDGAVPIGTPAIMMQTGYAQMAYGRAKTVLSDLGAIDFFYKDSDEYEFVIFDGQGGSSFIPMDQIAVAAGTKSSDLAENFVRLMLSEQIQQANLGAGFPVNRAALDALFEQQKEYSGGGSWNSLDLEYQYKCPEEKAIARFKELAESADTCLVGNPVLEEAVHQYGTLVLQGNGKVDVDSTVDQIKREMAIYLAE